MSTLREFAQRYLIPDAAPLSPAERWRSTLAALLGMLLIQGILAVLPAQPGISYLLAPLGASSVILFVAPGYSRPFWQSPLRWHSQSGSPPGCAASTRRVVQWRLFLQSPRHNNRFL